MDDPSAGREPYPDQIPLLSGGGPLYLGQEEHQLRRQQSIGPLSLSSQALFFRFFIYPLFFRINYDSIVFFLQKTSIGSHRCFHN